MATYAGVLGSAKFSGSNVTQITSWTCNVNMDQYEEVYMGTTWVGVGGGIVRWSGTMTCLLDSINGQNEILGNLTGATPTITPATLSLVVATSKYFTGSALVSQVGITHAAAALAQANFNFTGSGTLTKAWS